MAGCEVLVTSAAPPVKLVGTTERRYAPGHVNTGAIIMALWQFTTIAALIGVLLIYVMVLTNRIGATNALLKRIEDALVTPQSATGNTRASVAGFAAGMTAATAAERAVVSVAAERPGVAPAPLTRAAVGSARRGPTAGPAAVSARVPSPTADSVPMTARRPISEPATEAGAPEITDAPDVPDRDRRVSFLTVRDLKVIARSGRRSSDGTVGMSPLFREAMERKRAEARSLAESGQSHEDQTSDVVTEEVNVAGVVTEEAGVASAVPEETVVASAVAGEVRVASVESHEAMEESDGVGSPQAGVQELTDSPQAGVQELAGSLPLSVQELATATYEIRDFLESANVAAPETIAQAGPEMVTPTAAERNPDAANEYAEAAAKPMAANEYAKAAAVTMAANEHAAAEVPTPEAPTAVTEPQPAAAPQPVAAQAVDEDLLERRRKRDAQLILSAQRRRRRTRGF